MHGNYEMFSQYYPSNRAGKTPVWSACQEQSSLENSKYWEINLALNMISEWIDWTQVYNLPI